jgi:GTPase
VSFKSGHVALAGWTNVGKSTLLNRLAGEKIAAVADVPQTTRHRITGVVSVGGRGQIVFVDTPGFHRPRERMNPPGHRRGGRDRAR